MHLSSINLPITNVKKRTSAAILGWNTDGTLLATGCFDGHLRIWSRDGKLKRIFWGHEKCISCIKWSDDGRLLLTGSDDNTLRVWNVETGQHDLHAYETYEGTITDIDWKDSTLFAASFGHKIHIWNRSLKNNLEKDFMKHTGEVNAIRWDQTKSLLASCSDDHTVKIWDYTEKKLVHDFKEHSKEVNCIRWKPSDMETADSNQKLVLASASKDSTIKLWDVNSEELLNSFGHSDANDRGGVYNFAFSPDGKYLASGTTMGSIYIWSVEDNTLVRRFERSGVINDICWDSKGEKIAACSTNRLIYVLDFIT